MKIGRFTSGRLDTKRRNPNHSFFPSEEVTVILVLTGLRVCVIQSPKPISMTTDYVINKCERVQVRV